MQDQFIFREKLKMGESLLNEYRTRINHEIRRLSILTPFAYHRDNVNVRFRSYII